MNQDFDPKLAAQIDRRLKDLPDLAAPSGLIARTMNTLAQAEPARQTRAWASWPTAWRAVSLTLALGGLVAVFLGCRSLLPALASVTLPGLSRWAADAKCLWAALETLGTAVALLAHHFGPWLLPVCLALGVLAYAACVGFGTLLFRFAFAPSEKYRI